jgi:hypothetical protein
VTAGSDPARPRIVILADDLIWATRLAGIVRRAGADPMPVRSPGAMRESLPVDGCVIDLTALAYDGLAAVAAATAAGVPVVAVGQHDDADARRAARAAGAAHVYAYRALFEHGDRDLGVWIAGLGTDREEA